MHTSLYQQQMRVFQFKHLAIPQLIVRRKKQEFGKTLLCLFTLSRPKISQVIWGIKYICSHLVIVLYLTQHSNMTIICLDFKKQNIAQLIVFLSTVKLGNNDNGYNEFTPITNKVLLYFWYPKLLYFMILHDYNESRL